jgi:hypothetical protein
MTTHAMSVSRLVGELSRRGVRLVPTPDGDLRVLAPPGALTDDDRRIVKALKADIVAHLRAPAASAASPAADTGDVTAAAADDSICTAPGCTAVVDAYDESGQPWCAPA